MKFITEDDLRILLKKEPFTVYDLPGGTRLTPGARQFLVDKKIPITDDPMMTKPKGIKPTGNRNLPGSFPLKKENASGTVFGSGP